MSGVDPGWANDLLPAMLTGLCAEVESVRCQEIFDYSTYDQPDAVRYRVGMGQPMDEVPLMVAPSVPTMVWGGGVRMIARGLGVELDEIREVLERRPLERTVTNAMGTFEQGTQGALRFEVQGIVAGEPRIVIEHVTRIDPECAPDWPQPPSGAGAHRVVIEGSPRLEVTIEAEGRAATAPPAATPLRPPGWSVRSRGSTASRRASRTRSTPRSNPGRGRMARPAPTATRVTSPAPVTAGARTICSWGQVGPNRARQTSSPAGVTSATHRTSFGSTGSSPVQRPSRSLTPDSAGRHRRACRARRGTTRRAPRGPASPGRRRRACRGRS